MTGIEPSDEAMDRYCIPDWYRIRPENTYHDDTSYKDEWQREVYLYARAVMKTARLKTVYDIGCGSGFKLLKYLGEFDFIGFDLEPTVLFLKKTYPDRAWRVADFETPVERRADLVICADVIEHIPDPNRLVQFMKRVMSKYAIISTPDRNLVYRAGSPYLLGPPENECHVREWTFDEFAKYLSRDFCIVDHCVTNFRQGTQMALCVAS